MNNWFDIAVLVCMFGWFLSYSIRLYRDRRYAYHIAKLTARLEAIEGDDRDRFMQLLRERDLAEELFSSLAAQLGVNTEYTNSRSLEDVGVDAAARISDLLISEQRFHQMGGNS